MRADSGAARRCEPRDRGRIRARAGFSLIEMLVALVVFALAVLGLLNLAGESTRTAVAIEERVLAAVVADNVAVEAATLDVRALADEASGREHAGGRDWRWTRTTAPTADPALLRVDIRVSPPGESRVAAELALFRSLPR
ncbi:type II secretion system minor pseudopilin GspI [Luteimonas viscosa]|uniref:type II secretion system minor pseudopilin GspI n=1 Tax=Luteimonas viscosa TaxID=1132694 RepID=UPI003CCCE4BC